MIKIRYVIYTITLLVCTFVCSNSFASLFGGSRFVNNNCFSNFQPIIQRSIPHFANFNQNLATVFPTINYFVGAPIRVQSIIRQELQTDPEYREFLQFKQFKQYQSQALQQQPLIQPLSLVEKHCSKCHTGATPKGEFSINGVFTAIERDKAARAVILGKMPKSKELSPAEKGDLIKEILLLGVE